MLSPGRDHELLASSVAVGLVLVENSRQDATGDAEMKAHLTGAVVWRDELFFGW